MPPVAGGLARRPQLPPVVGIRPQTPTTPPPIADFWLRACMKRKFTAHYCWPTFILAFGFKYAWNVWRRCSHSQTVYNTAKSISRGNTHTEKLSQKNLSSAPTPLWLLATMKFFLPEHCTLFE